MSPTSSQSTPSIAAGSANAQSHLAAQTQTGSGDALVDVRGVAVRFGGIVALDGVSFTVGKARFSD